ncbi:MAG TPA: alpha/beta hydrolase [Candidatus Limnocylindrales bacterium]|nr:alpha/beta hydrolase [Candidatus Limnocylindrales bacterium]
MAGLPPACYIISRHPQERADVPTIKVNGVELYYKETGSGQEAIVFSHGLLMDHAMFEAQRAAFDGRYRVIAYDHRGQGNSQVASGSAAAERLDMDTLAEDAAALIEALNAAPCHFAGLSMGGFIGLRLAARRRELVRTLTLMNTGADPEAASSRLRYGLLARLVGLVGTAPFTGIAVKELFGRTARTSTDPGKRKMMDEWTEKLRTRPKSVAGALMGVMNRKGVPAEELAAIRCPTLIIAGEEDTAQPPFRGERMAAAIRNARLVRVPGCGHSSSLEQPEAVIEAMKELIQEQSAFSSRQAAP